MSNRSSETASRKQVVSRFRRWLFWGLAIAVVLYLGGSVYVGMSQVGGELADFLWWLAIPVLLLVLFNYGLRFLKWHFLLRQLGVYIPWRQDFFIFGSGLAMVISPGKAGELLKPWLVRTRSGVSLARSIPALVAERLTDAIAMLALAAFSITTYAGDKLHYILIPAALVAVGLLVLASEGLSRWLLKNLSRLPGLRKVGRKLDETYAALRTCLAPVPLVAAVLVSMAAWWAECVAYWLVFKGFHLEASVSVSTFLYAFATVAGGALPGGLGVADGALGGGAYQLVEGITQAQAVASALLIRLATLWFGVGLGSIALLRVDKVLDSTGKD